MLRNTDSKTVAAIASAVLLPAAIYWVRRLYGGIRVPVGKAKGQITFDDTTYGGKLVAEVLANHGVKFVFTLVGGHISPILVGCKEKGIRVIDVRHEVTTVFAADAVARLSGVPGVAAVTAGPGLTNTITAVKNAQLAQSPLVLLGGATSDLLKGRGSLQDIDQQALLAPHVKWMAHITSVADIIPTLEMAFAVAQEGVPGPVFVEFPLDVLYPEKIAREWYVKSTRKATSLLQRAQNWYINYHVNKIFSAAGRQLQIHAPPTSIPFPVPSASQVAKVVQRLVRAKRPVLVVGSQAAILPSWNTTQTPASLQAAVEKLGLPTYLSSMARGLLGKDSAHLLRHTRSKALREADVVILAGVVCDFRLQYGQSIGRGAYYVNINRSGAEMRKNRTPTLGIEGDPATFLHMLAAALPPTAADAWAAWAAELHAGDGEREVKIAQDAAVPAQQAERLNPVFVCKHIDAALNDNSILVADGGDFVGTASYIVRPRAPLTWLDPGVFGTLGCGAGFALGAKLVHPEAEVWCIFGDGAFGYSIPEYDTFVRHNIPVISVIGNDGAWMQIYRGQVDMFKDDVACALSYTDYDRVVEGFNARGLLLNDPNQVPAILAQAKEIAKQGTPVVVNCLIGRSDFRKDSISM